MQLKKVDGEMTCFKRPLEPYIVSLDEQEKLAYQRLRIGKEAPTIPQAEALTV